MFRKILAPLKDAPNTATMPQSPPKSRRRDPRGKENVTTSSPVHISQPSDFRLVAHVECDPNTGHYKGIDEFMTLATLPRGRRSPIKSRIPHQGLPLPPTRSVASLQGLAPSVEASVLSPEVSKMWAPPDEECTSTCGTSEHPAEQRIPSYVRRVSDGNISLESSPSSARPPKAPVRAMQTSPVTPLCRLATGRANVSRPMCTKHIVHVQLDPTSPIGFAGLPLAWENILKLSGILHHEAVTHPEAVIDVLNFSKAAQDAPHGDSASALPALPPIRLESLPSVTSFDDVCGDVLVSHGPATPSESIPKCDSYSNLTVGTFKLAQNAFPDPMSSSPSSAKDVETFVMNEMNSDYMENFIGAERGDNLPDALPDYIDGTFREDNPESLFSRIESIGEGSSGNVYRALDREGKFIALKKVFPENDRDWKLFKFEVRVMQEQSESENLVDCYDAFRHGDELWMVMEYVSAGTISDLLAGRRAIISSRKGGSSFGVDCDSVECGIDESVIAFICREVLQGLQSLHSIRRIHRDIKSANVLLDLDGSVKVGDFGFCAELCKRIGKRNTVVGTSCWMAPEVIRGLNYDTKADIWSTGILALECAQGRPPHMDVSPIRAMFLIATQGAPEMPQNCKWSDDLHNFIRTCCSTKPSSRPSAQEALLHPFISKACAKEDAAAFFNEACEERMRFRRNL